MALADRERLRGDSSGVGGVLPDSSLSPRRRPADLGQAAGLSKCRPSFTSFAPITSCAADKAVSRSDELTLRDFGGLQAPPPARRPPGSFGRFGIIRSRTLQLGLAGLLALLPCPLAAQSPVKLLYT